MNVGGPALQVVGLHDGLDPDRFEQRLLTGTPEPGEEDYLALRAPHVAAHIVPGLGRSLRTGGDALALVALAREIRAFRPDIVHTHTAKAGVLGRVAAILGRVPGRVHTFHGHLLHGYFSPRATRAVIRVERTLARRTSRLIAVGHQVRDDLLDAGIGREDQYTVVPPGIRTERAPSRPEAREALRLPHDRPVVAFVARLTAIKRPDRFVGVAARVIEARPDALFLIAGEGDELEQTRRAAHPLGDSVRFLGWRGDVETIYAAADVTVLTSDNEGMPVSLIEAAAAGCPAVTTRVGSADEVVLDGVTGVVTGADEQGLADAVVKLLGDFVLRAQMGRAARAHAQKHFSRERLVRDITNIYEAVAVEKGLPCKRS
ncbi:MAG TPA: glycosyltransferase family 4 protein [Acidimicrobiia bacterium]|nr:glycosyltransferase family 4 protein [Acidimicrobiia bacterium]